MLPLILQVLMLFAGGLEVPQVLLPMLTDTAHAVGTSFPVGRPEAATIGQAWIAEDGRLHRSCLVDNDTRHGATTDDALGRSKCHQPGVPASVVTSTSFLRCHLASLFAFQLPLAVLLLSWIGIVKVETLRKRRNWALLVCAIVAALTTPADVFSMLIMLIPLYMLYELGILLATWLPASRMARGRN